MQEITAPLPTKYLRYPHGAYNDLVEESAKLAGYEKAYAVTQGTHDDPYRLYSNYVDWP